MRKYNLLELFELSDKELVDIIIKKGIDPKGKSRGVLIKEILNSQGTPFGM